MATSRYLINIFTRHQVLLERLKAGVVKEFDPTLREIDKMIRKELGKYNVALVSDLPYSQLKKLIANIQREERKLLNGYAKTLDKNLRNTAAYEATFAEQALRNAIIGDVTIHTVRAAKAWAAVQAQPIQATGQMLEPFTEKWTLSQLQRVEGTLRNAHAQGWTVGDTVRAIRGTKKNGYRDGILATTTRETEAMVRTSMRHASNAARTAVYSENSDIVSGYRWISTLDASTTSTCRSLDQQVFELGKGPMPPIHIGCRSTTVPELFGVDIYETPGLKSGRASKGAEGGKQVKLGTTYYEWLKGQPEDFQKAAIGAKRTRLLRDGGLTSSEFARLNIGRDFQPLTLDEMRELNPVAFSKAGI